MGKVADLSRTTLQHIDQLICEQVGSQRHELWFENKTKFRLEADTLTIGVPNLFFHDWLQSNFRDAVQQAAVVATGQQLRVRFVVDPTLFQDNRRQQAQNAGSRSSKDAPPVMKSSRNDCRTSDSPVKRHRLSFDSFVVGRCNKLAYTAAKQIAESPDANLNPFLVYGGVGLGKTHLLMAIAQEARKRNGRAKVQYLTAERFTNEFLLALHKDALPAFREKYRRYDVLAIDEIQFLAGKRATQEEFLHTFNELIAGGAQLVLACDSHPKVLSRMHAGLVARLQGGMSCRLERPDYETRLAIARSKATRMGHQFPDEVLEYVATHLTNDVREMEGALNCLAAHDTLTEAKIELATAREALAELVHHTVRVIRLVDVEKAICQFFRIEPHHLKGKRRVRATSYPRMLAMYLARQHTGITYTEIGAFFGGRNHSTVVAAEKRVQQWLQEGKLIQISDQTWSASQLLQLLEKELNR